MMRVKDLPPNIQELAIQRHKEQCSREGTVPDAVSEIMGKSLSACFVFDGTPEGHEWWMRINMKNLSPAKRLAWEIKLIEDNEVQ